MSLTMPNLADRTKVISIKDAAAELGVSEASIRNWIKTGYFKQSRSNLITIESFELFKTKIVGSEKLTKRANKSHRDVHNHSLIVKAFSENSLDSLNISNESLGQAYENSLSESHRNAEGIYYTPDHIVSSFFSNIDFDVREKTFLDPCCGSGNFLLQALRFGFLPENIYGFDTDATAIAIARRRLAELCEQTHVNLSVLDFLFESPTTGAPTKYDVIFTNPPWGKKISPTKRKDLSLTLDLTHSTDSSGFFATACLNRSTTFGMVGLLLPDAFFNVAAFQSARKHVLNKSILRITNHGKPFKGVLSGAKSLIVRNSKPGDSMVVCEMDGKKHLREQASFLANPKVIINAHCCGEDAKVISRSLSISHVTLSGNAEWGLGIVTGNNEKFVRSEPAIGYIPVFKGSEVFKDRMEGPTTYIPNDLSLYQQVAAENIYRAKEKLIYRFISSKLVFFHDTEQRFVLNSANVVVPNRNFPVKMSILSQYFSSDFVNWFFGTVFSTHKILRADIESIPIFADFLGQMTFFDEDDLLRKMGLYRSNGGYRIT